jgi:hypothetical protein
MNERERDYSSKLISNLKQTIDVDEGMATRLLERLRNGLAKGGVYYVLTFFLIVTALTFARFGWLLVSQHYDRLRDDVSSLLTGRFEPRDSAFGVVPATLSAVDGADAASPEALCPSSEEDCVKAEHFLTAFKALAARWQEEGTVPFNLTEESRRFLIGTYRHTADSKEGSDSMKADEKRLEETFAVWREIVSEPDHCPDQGASNSPSAWWECPDLYLSGTRCEERREQFGEEKGPSHDSDWGPVFCESHPDKFEEHIRLSISPLIVPGEQKANAKGDVLFDSAHGYPPIRLAKAIRISRLLAPALLASGFDIQGSPPSPNRYSFVQAYFISPDDILRIWQRSTLARTGSAADQFPRTRHWSEQNYFAVLKDGRTREETSAVYIDYGTNGFVRSRCRAIEGERNPETHVHELLGAVCADTTVPVALLGKRLRGGQLLEAHWVSAPLDIDGQFHGASILVQSMDELAEGRPPARTVPDLANHIASELNSVLREQHVSASQSLDVLSRQVIRLTPDDLPPGDEAEPLFFVPGGRRGNALEGFVVHPGVVYPNVASYLFASSALCLLAALGIGTMGTIRARTRNEGAVVAELLRSLTVGVLLVDEGDTIEAANDRAEQVLGVPIARFGPSLDLARGIAGEPAADMDAVRWRISDLIENKIWIVVDEHKIRMASYRENVKEARQRGDSSSYYATLRLGKNAGRYIMISAAPIEPNRRLRTRDWPRTFGIVEELTEARTGELEQRIDQLNPTSSIELDPRP